MLVIDQSLAVESYVIEAYNLRVQEREYSILGMPTVHSVRLQIYKAPPIGLDMMLLVEG